MAIGNTTQLAELIRLNYDAAFASLISRDEFMMQRLPKQPVTGDGIRWKVQDDAKNTSVGSYAESASLPTAVAHKYLEAKLTHRYVWGVIEVTGQAIAQTQGEGGFKAALRSEIDETMLDMRNQINSYLLGATAAGTDIDGIQTWNKDSATYATIDPATYTGWAAYKNANSGTARALTVALMQDVKTKVEDTPRFGKVSVILTGPTQWNNYGNLLTSLRRFRPEDTLDGGFQALDFEGVPVVKVPSFVSGRMDFISERDNKGQANIVYRVLRNFDVQDKSQTVADGAKFVIYHYANVQCRNRRINGFLADLS